MRSEDSGELSLRREKECEKGKIKVGTSCSGLMTLEVMFLKKFNIKKEVKDIKNNECSI